MAHSLPLLLMLPDNPLHTANQDIQKISVEMNSQPSHHSSSKGFSFSRAVRRRSSLMAPFLTNPFKASGSPRTPRSADNSPQPNSPAQGRRSSTEGAEGGKMRKEKLKNRMSTAFRKQSHGSTSPLQHATTPSPSGADMTSPKVTKPAKLSKSDRRRSSYGGALAAPSTSTALPSFNLSSLRRSSLPSSTISFRRQSLPKGPDAFPMPAPPMPNWPNGFTKVGRVPEMSPVLEGLGIDVDRTPQGKASGSMPPRIPTPVQTSPRGEQVLFDLGSIPPLTYSPMPTAPQLFEPLPTSNPSPANSRPSSVVSKRSKGSSSRVPPPTLNGGASTATLRPGSSQSSRPRSSASNRTTVSTSTTTSLKPEAELPRFAKHDPEVDDEEIDLAPPVPQKSKDQHLGLKRSSRSLSSSSLVPPGSRTMYRDGGSRSSMGNAGSKRNSASMAQELLTRRSMSLDTPSSSKRSTMVSVSSKGSRRSTYDPELQRKPLPTPGAANLFVMRPTVSVGTQTPCWGIDTGYSSQPISAVSAVPSYSVYDRIHEEETHQHMLQAGPPSPGSIYPPSPSVYSVRSMAWHQAQPRRTSGYEDYTDDYEEISPDTPVAILTATTRRVTPPPTGPAVILGPVPVRVAKPSPPLSLEVQIVEPKSTTPTFSNSFDGSIRVPSPFADPSGYQRPSPRLNFETSPRSASVHDCSTHHLSGSPPPSPPHSAASSFDSVSRTKEPWAPKWTEPAVVHAGDELSASAIANKIRRRSTQPKVETADPNELMLPTSGQKERPVSMFNPNVRRKSSGASKILTPPASPPRKSSMTLLVPGVDEGVAVARPRRRSSGDKHGERTPHQALSRAEKGRSFFLVQALNNPDKVPGERIRSHYYDSAEESSDDSEGESVF
ncbi:hypothetical protein T439DRAFT_324389 [Meredithblackwellia eburnea MCA 4105]